MILLWYFYGEIRVIKPFSICLGQAHPFPYPLKKPWLWMKSPKGYFAGRAPTYCCVRRHVESGCNKYNGGRSTWSFTSKWWGTFNLPLGAFRGKVDRFWGSPLETNWDFLNPNENCSPLCPTSEKTLSLDSWRSLVHKFHIECIPPSRFKFQYTCAFHLVNRQLIGIAFLRWNCQITMLKTLKSPHKHKLQNLWLTFRRVLCQFKMKLQLVCWFYIFY